MYFLLMNSPCTFGVFPTKKSVNSPKAVPVNRQDPVWESFCQGNNTLAVSTHAGISPALKRWFQFKKRFAGKSTLYFTQILYLNK